MSATNTTNNESRTSGHALSVFAKLLFCKVFSEQTDMSEKSVSVYPKKVNNFSQLRRTDIRTP